jgi:hypothetical protein
VVEELGVEDAVRVVTELAAAVFREVEDAAADAVVLAAPWT